MISLTRKIINQRELHKLKGFLTTITPDGMVMILLSLLIEMPAMHRICKTLPDTAFSVNSIQKQWYQLSSSLNFS